MVKCVNLLIAVFLLSCTPSLQSLGVRKGSIPKVRAVFKALDPAFSDKVPPYQERLDNALEKAARKKDSFIPIFSTDSITNADYEILALIDSVYLVSEEYQKKQVKVINSLKVVGDTINEFIAREEAKPPVFIGTKTIGGGGGISFLGEIALAVNNNQIDRESIKPRIIGRVEVRNNQNNTSVWVKKFDIHDKYDRFVTYSEQLDMIFRILIGDMRFRYRTPFIYEN